MSFRSVIRDVRYSRNSCFKARAVGSDSHSMHVRTRSPKGSNHAEPTRASPAANCATTAGRTPPQPSFAHLCTRPFNTPSPHGPPNSSAIAAGAGHLHPASDVPSRIRVGGSVVRVRSSVRATLPGCDVLMVRMLVQRRVQPPLHRALAAAAALGPAPRG